MVGVQPFPVTAVSCVARRVAHSIPVSAPVSDAVRINAVRPVILCVSGGAIIHIQIRIVMKPVIVVVVVDINIRVPVVYRPVVSIAAMPTPVINGPIRRRIVRARSIPNAAAPPRRIVIVVVVNGSAKGDAGAKGQ